MPIRKESVKLKKTNSGKNPRLSVNKLAEYLEANSLRRKKIVLDAKYPSKFIVTRYKDARNHMIEYVSKLLDESDMLLLVDEFLEKEFDTDFQENDNKLSSEALEKILDIDVSEILSCESEPFDGTNAVVHINGVDISVHPDVILRRELEGIPNIGAVKFHISKNILSEEGQKIVGLLLHQYLTESIARPGEAVNPKMCYSVDVHNSSINCCPSAFKMRLKRIEGACEEICLWWDKL